MITKVRTKKYSFESVFKEHFSSFTNNDLLDKFDSIKDEISNTYDEVLNYKLFQMLKMLKRELIKRDLYF
ncbi:MAG: hypothetical protein U0354_20085 [Candidatus Sericytochromatia bacterium]